MEATQATNNPNHHPQMITRAAPLLSRMSSGPAAAHLPRFNRYASRNGAVTFKSREPLTLDQIGQIIPSAFAESAHSSRSERYAYIPTR